MADSTTHLIKEKLDIVEFLKGYITLVPAGRNFKAICPFHTEKTPSMSVSPDRGTWHCFGCGAGGDIFEFLMKYEHIEFAEALKFLSEKAGVPLARVNPAEYKAAGLLYDINTAATEFFKKSLSSTPVAMEYLVGRGLKKETIEEFELGWAPNEPDSLTVHLIRQLGMRPQDVTEAGLGFLSQRGLHLDRFRGRLMFPIHNHLGKVVGFTGRIYPPLDTGQQGKYVNSPETAIFNKSKLLYGFYKTKEAIREKECAFVVEGQMDFLMSYQAGITNGVASSGTAFTTQHLGALSKVCSKLIFNFDSDEAGIAAGERAVDMAHEAGFEVLISRLPDPYKDPAEAVVKDPKILQDAYAHATPALRVFLERYVGMRQSSDYFATNGGIKKLRTLLSKLRHIQSAVSIDTWLNEIARATGIAVHVLRDELRQMETEGTSTQSNERNMSNNQEERRVSQAMLTRHQRLSFELLVAAHQLQDFGVIESSRPHLASGFEIVYDLLKSKTYTHEKRDVDGALQAILMSSESYGKDDLGSIMIHLEREYVRARRQELIDKVRQAEIVGDESTAQKALHELASLPHGNEG